MITILNGILYGHIDYFVLLWIYNNSISYKAVIKIVYHYTGRGKNNDMIFNLYMFEVNN